MVNHNQIIHLILLNIIIQVYLSLSYPYARVLVQSLPIWMYNWDFMYDSYIGTIYSASHPNNQRKINPTPMLMQIF